MRTKNIRLVLRKWSIIAKVCFNAICLGESKVSCVRQPPPRGEGADVQAKIEKDYRFRQAFPIDWPFIFFCCYLSHLCYLQFKGSVFSCTSNESNIDLEMARKD